MSLDWTVAAGDPAGGEQAAGGNSGANPASAADLAALVISPWSIIRRSMKSPSLSLSDLGIVCSSLLLATLLRLLLDPLLEDRAVYVSYLLAVLFVAWSRGLWPALLTVTIGALLANYLFIPPRYSFIDEGLDHHVSTALNLVLGVATALLCDVLRESALENARLFQIARDAALRKDEFLAMVSHELRSPLAPISNAVYILSRIEPKGSKVSEMCELLERQVRHLVRLVDDLLDVSRITKGKIQLRKTPVELNVIFDGAVEIIRPLITEKKQALTVSLPAAPIQLYGDAVRLMQVFANLLNNAAKYSASGGRIWLSAESVGGQVVVRVRDNGIGIAPEAAPKVFDLFEQARGVAGGPQGGLGVGLAIVSRLVEMHSGTVQVHSPGIGLGSEFIVRLPIDTGDEHAAAASSQPEKPAAPALAGHHRILVVDDNESTANSLGIILKLWKYEVQICYDAFSALEVARTFKPEIVLADIGLPQMNGLELAVELRTLPAMENSIFVAITGYGMPADKAAAEAAGFSRHLVKPINPPDLEGLLYELQAKT